jgi:hypothetical protein
MPSKHSPTDRQRRSDDISDEPELTVSDETLVVRNYDGDESHSLSVRLVGADDETAFSRTYTLDPMASISVQTRLSRAVYRVVVQLDGNGTDRADCLLGSGPNETALVEIGNGQVSVVEGVA